MPPCPMIVLWGNCHLDTSMYDSSRKFRQKKTLTEINQLGLGEFLVIINYYFKNLSLYLDLLKQITDKNISWSIININEIPNKTLI